MQTVKKIKNLKNKKVIVRVDFNVPIKGGKIEDDFRIKKALPTLKYLIAKGAYLILVTHLGKDGSASLDPVIKHFFKISKISKKKVEFLENVRKFPGEEKNDKIFAKELASRGDIYVNDAFSVSHRVHASVCGITEFLPAYAGFQMESEVKNLSLVLNKVKHPFLFILGGAKFSTKMPLIEKYIKTTDNIFIGGALFNDFLETMGLEVGKSLVDNSISVSDTILKNKKLILPTDLIVKSGAKLVNKKINEVKKNEVILDIGTESIKNLTPYISKAKLILWNGPMGKYEDIGGGATKAILKLVAKSKAISIIGGGDTVEIISENKMEKKFTFVSTGGGATLDFLVDGTLPGIQALK